MQTTCRTEVHVTVHYIAAERPFAHEEASDETIGKLKKQVLTAFGLTEGTTPDGSNVTYTLYHGKAPLENPQETIGEVAQHRHALELKLVQQITQG